jgi:flagellar hook assembly protein FlgD
LAGNPSTTIPFHLEKATSVKLAVINLMGQTVRTLAAGQMSAGDHSMAWDGRNEAGEIVSSGAYLIRLQNGNRTRIKKLMLMK